MYLRFVAAVAVAFPLWVEATEARSASAERTARFVANTTHLKTGLRQLLEGNSLQYSTPNGHPSTFYFETADSYRHLVSYESKLTQGHWSIATTKSGSERLCVEHQSDQRCFAIYARQKNEYGFQSYAMIRQMDDVPTYELFEASIGKGVSESIANVLKEEAAQAELKGTGEDPVLVDELILAYTTFLKLKSCSEQLHIPVMHTDTVAAWAKQRENALKMAQSEKTLWNRAVSLATADVTRFLRRDRGRQYEFCKDMQQMAGKYVVDPVEADKPF